jgi:hypothetical protein
MLVETMVVTGDLTNFTAFTLSMRVLTGALGVPPLGTQETLSEWRAPFGVVPSPSTPIANPVSQGDWVVLSCQSCDSVAAGGLGPAVGVDVIPYDARV